MELVLIHNHYDADHLAEVTAIMATMGAPEIKAVRIDGDLWQALEGCHRIRAAHALGLTPMIIEITPDDEMTANDLGLDWQDNDLIVDFIDRANSNMHRMVSFAF